jgi:hypothetical protein
MKLPWMLQTILKIQGSLRNFCLLCILTKLTSLWRWCPENANCKNSDYYKVYHSHRTTIYIWQNWPGVWNKGSRLWVMVSIWNLNCRTVKGNKNQKQWFFKDHSWVYSSNSRCSRELIKYFHNFLKIKFIVYIWRNVTTSGICVSLYVNERMRERKDLRSPECFFSGVSFSHWLSNFNFFVPLILYL